ncbi:MAG: molybdopterin-dependent oxidoreductase, partial [Burkholderiales bacterium]|nr:molybdopterin-dependent oxidoreductase [Burkholderiales bacterium]
MTNHWVDIKNANLVTVMGGNPAEAHPVGFRWAIDAKINNGAKILVIDPRFTRSAAQADEYVQLRPGTDITFLLGVIHYLISNDKIQHEYVRNYTNASFLVRDDFAFHDGLFSGYDAEKRTYNRSSWAYQLDELGFAKRDPSLSHPRCVWNLLREHVSRYTPEVVENICGTTQDRFKVACELIAETSVPHKTMTSMYALGWTEHTVGAQNIRAMAMIQLLLGNIGMPGGGINALRGHTNVQGITDLGIMATALPGYLALPSERQHPDFRTFLSATTPKLQVQGQVNFWGNYPKFFTSLLKSFYGDNATPDNDFGYDWLPKWDRSNDFMYTMSAMEDGLLNGCICQGVNLLAMFPDSNKSTRALSKLKYFVGIDPLDCETSSFWENHGEFNDVNPASIQTEVFRLPSSCFAEEEGSRVNSGRWLQWHWKGSDVPGEGRDDTKNIAGIMMAVRRLYEQEGGKATEPLLNMSWN